jgi:hypothetical protein
LTTWRSRMKGASIIDALSQPAGALASTLPKENLCTRWEYFQLDAQELVSSRAKRANQVG